MYRHSTVLIIQRKTKTPVTIGVADPMAIDIVLNDFPKALSQVMFNKQIKTICKNAGINDFSNLCDLCRWNDKRSGDENAPPSEQAKRTRY